MKKILLACSAGMSTSLLVQKMQAAAAEEGVEVSIEAQPVAKAKRDLNDYDIVLLGPQVRYMEGEMKKAVKGDTKVAVIDMMAYGTMDGAKVLKTALADLG